MMGRDEPPQGSLFYTGINLEKRVRREHVLRRVARLVDFEFVHGEVKDRYGYNGNVSVAPPVILKLILLLGKLRWGRIFTVAFRAGLASVYQHTRLKFRCS